MAPFSVDDIRELLRELVRQLADAGTPAGIRIVGGAAIALLYFDRMTMTDVVPSFIP